MNQQTASGVAAEGGAGGSSEKGMRQELIAGFLGRLKPPHILKDPAWIPTFRQTCYPPHTDSAPETSQKMPGHSSEEAIRLIDGEIRPVSWQKHLAAAPKTAFSDSFCDLLKRVASPRLIFFGEQHHQPHVIRAQIQLLAAVVEKSKRLEECAEGRPIKYCVHLLMEHFALSDQPLLDRFRLGSLNIVELCSAYHQRSDEGFRLEMYAPLLLLARESGVHLWGGFPKRSWAKTAMYEGIERVESLEEERSRTREKDPERVSQGSDGSTSISALSPPPPLPFLPPVERLAIPPFDGWDNACTLTSSHRAFLSSLMKPDKPPFFAKLPALANLRAYLPDYRVVQGGLTACRYPTEHITYPKTQKRGFAPAQALKDSYLAHAASCLLYEGHHLASTPSQPVNLSKKAGRQSDSDEGVEHRNIVMVVAGLGHIQAGFGGPERIWDWICHYREPTRTGVDDSIIVLSMPNDSSLWLGPEWQGKPMFCPVDGGDDEGASGASGAPDTKPFSRAALMKNSRERIPEGWDRKLANAIVLYDWVDFDAEAQPQPQPQPQPQAQPEAAASEIKSSPLS